MKITKEIIERIEGEATLELEWNEGKIDFAKIKFFNFRGIERILEKRPLYDALAITPRVCGICSHSHAIASVLAIEACFADAGETLKISPKAKDIREIILNSEKIHNHIKWYFFSILPELEKFYNPHYRGNAFKDPQWQEAQKAIMNALKVGATFSGQWPHGSFVMAGGVSCDPLKSDVVQALNFLERVIDFCEKTLLGMSIEEFLSFNSALQLMAGTECLTQSIEKMTELGFSRLGRSYGRFLALGESIFYDVPSKALKTSVLEADIKYVNESLEHTFFDTQEQGYTYSKSALYKKNFYEVGPLARMMIGKDALIRDFHRRFKDATMTRVVARIAECVHLLKRTHSLLLELNIDEISLTPPRSTIDDLCAEGIGIVEAPRGTLIHKVCVEYGHIKSYDIVTPTVWNLGNGDKKNPSVAQKALIGLSCIEEADFIFKGFDVCSVCTTQ